MIVAGGRQMRYAVVTVFVVALGMGPLVASGGPPSVKAGGGHAVKVGPTTTTRAPGSGKGSRVGAAPRGTKGGPAKTTGVKVTGAKSTTRPTGAGKPAGTANGKQVGTSTSTSAPSEKRQHTASTSTTPSTAAGTETATGPNVPKNPKLQARLQAMLPEGMTLADAAASFKNQGQFIAALHVSENLGIPFTELKTRMVDEGFSLGQAIQDVKPTLNGTTEARRGEQQAAADLR
jgi:hypothetical protein